MQKEKNFKKSYWTKQMKFPFQDLPDNALGHYQLQLPFYGRLILKMLDSAKGSITKPEELNEGLGLVKDKYLLSENQAQAILEMKLSRLTALEQDKILLDYKVLIDSIKGYQLILNDNKILMNFWTD